MSFQLLLVPDPIFEVVLHLSLCLPLDQVLNVELMLYPETVLGSKLARFSLLGGVDLHNVRHDSLVFSNALRDLLV